MLRRIHFAAAAFALAVACYALGLPLIRERDARGNYLFGHYGLQEIYVGFPALLVGLGLLALWFIPRARRRRLAGPLVVVPVAVIAAVFAFDLFYVFGIAGAGSPDYWLDAQHVSRVDNEPDPELGFRRKPHVEWSGGVRGTERVASYRADEKGFRNPPGIENADIVFVGDSYTEAAQVDESDTFVRRVGELTGKSVVNLGRGAYGPQQERIVLERHAFDYEPELIVWQFFGGNDLRDAENYATWRTAPDRLPVASLEQRYFQNSVFHPLLLSTFEGKEGDFARFVDDDGVEHPLRLRYRWRPRQTEMRPEGWAATEAAVREGIAVCRARDVRIAVLIVPVFARVYAERLRFDDPAVRDEYVPDVTDPTTNFASALTRLCAELDVPVIDLYPVFAEAARQRDDLYLLRDEHLDVAGHQLVAETLARLVP